ncbi:MAG: hypothetical protein ACRCZF_19165 [Gemmataceae bacterium]
MELLAIAGGVPIGGLEGCGCCGFLFVLPAIVYLCLRALILDSFWSVFLAFLLALIQFLLLRGMLNEYHGSDDSEVRSSYKQGERDLEIYAQLVVFAAMTMIMVVLRRWINARENRGLKSIN